ncbi:MAG: pyrroloquinoline quinone-dependent dehydrogenase [Acidobacteria bacterium]|nr:MAG: pyrroloquinoline quinone-dependent dehydrogenase [Acidobacteriota bacterium]
MRPHALTLLLLIGAGAAVWTQAPSTGTVEWTDYGGNLTGAKYSGASDITRENVDRLQVAWEWHAPDKAMPGPGGASVLPGNFNSTPLMIDNVVYLSTPFGSIVALDAETGRQLWLYDPESWREPGFVSTARNHRGVAVWRNGNETRVFSAAKWRLIGLDGRTGKPAAGFGINGVVDLSAGQRWAFDKVQLDNLSAPTVYKDLVIVGSAIGDRLMFRNDPPGSVRAYDVHTGKEVWTWYTVPRPGELGNDTWERDSWATTGHGNIWAKMSVDAERGLLYVPTSTPSNDFYGGYRLGANLFAETLLCLDAATGKRKWHFQTTHHGLWDYDLGSQPNLVTITVNGRRIDAVAQISKMGFTFVFDRVTGQPVWPIEERPVPTDSNVPGERVYPTQPFPTKPPPFARQGFTVEDVFDLTPELKAAALAEIAKNRYRFGPLYTPPTIEGSFQRPDMGGAVNWPGAAFDPETGLLYVKSSESLQVTKAGALDKKGGVNPFAATSDFEYAGGPQNLAASATFMNGLPLHKPPYAMLTAIDLNRGEISWRVPFGKGSNFLRNHPALKNVSLPDRLGTPGGGAPIVTKGGLLFIGGGESALIVVDKSTGLELRRLELPRRANATPMTYRSRAGRQFVLMSTGNGSDAVLMAFALSPL